MGYFQWDTNKVDNTNVVIRLVLAILSGIKLLVAALLAVYGKETVI